MRTIFSWPSTVDGMALFSGRMTASPAALPRRFASVEELESFLAMPSPALVAEMQAIAGDLLILGVVIAVFAPLGDLTESMFKRNLDVKDFGALVSGHGGVLDRFDAFLFVLPVTYYVTLVIEPWT